MNGARENLDHLRQLDGHDSQSLSLENEISALETEISANEDAIERAQQAMESGNKISRWTHYAHQRQSPQALPAGPEDIDLKRGFLPTYLIGGLGIIVLLVLLIMGISLGAERSQTQFMNAIWRKHQPRR